MNNRGDIQSLVIMIIIILGLAIGAIIFSKVFLDITAEIKDMPEFSNRTVETIEMVEDKTIPLLDFLIFFALVAFMIGLIVASIYIDVHPAITIVFIVAIIVAVFLSGIFANIYGEITGEAQLSSTAAEFSYTNIILGQYFPLIVLFVGTAIVVILYGKSRRVGEV